MRHAAPRNNGFDRRLNHAGELLFACAVYAVAGLTTGLVTLGTALTVWGLWQWMGVS